MERMKIIFNKFTNSIVISLLLIMTSCSTIDNIGLDVKIHKKPGNRRVPANNPNNESIQEEMINAIPPTTDSKKMSPGFNNIYDNYQKSSASHHGRDVNKYIEKYNLTAKRYPSSNPAYNPTEDNGTTNNTKAKKQITWKGQNSKNTHTISKVKGKDLMDLTDSEENYIMPNETNNTKRTIYRLNNNGGGNTKNSKTDTEMDSEQVIFDYDSPLKQLKTEPKLAHHSDGDSDVIDMVLDEELAIDLAKSSRTKKNTHTKKSNTKPTKSKKEKKGNKGKNSNKGKKGNKGKNQNTNPTPIANIKKPASKSSKSDSQSKKEIVKASKKLVLPIPASPKDNPPPAASPVTSHDNHTGNNKTSPELESHIIPEKGKILGNTSNIMDRKELQIPSSVPQTTSQKINAAISEKASSQEATTPSRESQKTLPAPQKDSAATPSLGLLDGIPNNIPNSTSNSTNEKSPQKPSSPPSLPALPDSPEMKPINLPGSPNTSSIAEKPSKILSFYNYLKNAKSALQDKIDVIIEIIF